MIVLCSGYIFAFRDESQQVGYGIAGREGQQRYQKGAREDRDGAAGEKGPVELARDVNMGEVYTKRVFGYVG